MNTNESILDWRPSAFGRAAFAYATRWRLRVFPLLVENREPHFRSAPRGPENASLDVETIRTWWTAAPKCNVGLACARSDLLVVQVDPTSEGRETMVRLALALGPLPLTWQARTPAGVAHCYFRHVGPCDDWVQLGPGVQLKHRGYTVAPPSVEADGGRYVWAHHPLRTRLARLPPAWRARVASGTGTPLGEWNLDARESFLGIAFEATGWLGKLLPGGRRVVRCPWQEKHSLAGGPSTDRDDDGSVAVLGPALVGSRLGRFRCPHPCCNARDVLDVIQVLPPFAVDVAADAFPSTYERLLEKLGRASGMR